MKYSQAGKQGDSPQVKAKSRERLGTGRRVAARDAVLRNLARVLRPRLDKFCRVLEE